MVLDCLFENKVEPFLTTFFILFSLVKRRDDALPCAVTNLLLNPSNEHMHSNMKYYTEMGYSVDDVQPREVCSQTSYLACRNYNSPKNYYETRVFRANVLCRDSIFKVVVISSRSNSVHFIVFAFNIYVPNFQFSWVNT